jgi:excisionase family DNA binding protein
MKNNLLTTAEAAEYIGVTLSYMHKMMMNKTIAYYKPNGKLCYFEKEDLDRWLRRIRIASIEEVEQDAIAYMTNKDLLG